MKAPKSKMENFSSFLGKKRKMEAYVNLYRVYNALQLGIINTEQVLEYLLSAEITDATLIAYRHLLLKVPGDQHYVKGVHFLSKAPPVYGAVYALSSAPKMIKVTPNGEEQDSGMFVYLGVLAMQEDPNFAEKIKLICDVTTTKFIIASIPLVIRSRSEKILDRIDPRFYNTAFKIVLEVDWIEKVKFFASIQGLEIILKTCKDRSAEYGQRIIPLYKNIIEEFWNNRLFLPNKDIPKKIQEVFPDFFPKFMEKLSSTAWFISQLPSHIQGYILGFPIHLRKASSTELKFALLRLSEIGAEKYAQEYAMNHKIFYLQKPEVMLGFSNVCKNEVNDKDTLEEDVFSYPCFDVISIERDDKRYYFTRPEFNNLIKTGKNHWTMLPLFYEEMVLISARIDMTNSFQFPDSLPMLDLLNKIETYTPVIVNGQVTLQEPNKIKEGESVGLNQILQLLSGEIPIF